MILSSSSSLPNGIVPPARRSYNQSPIAELAPLLQHNKREWHKQPVGKQTTQVKRRNMATSKRFVKVRRVGYRIPGLAIIAALVCSVGLHWGFLQSVAWVGMVVNYSQSGTVTEALAKTFDGKHPCALCKTIAKGKQTEKKSEFPAKEKKVALPYSTAVFVFGTPMHFWKASGLDEEADSLNLAPPVPPPRITLG